MRSGGDRWKPVDLLGVEHHGIKCAGPLKLDLLFPLAALGVQHGLTALVPNYPFLLELPVLDKGAFLALPHLCALGGGLLVGQPAIISPALGHEIEDIDAAIENGR